MTYSYASPGVINVLLPSYFPLLFSLFPLFISINIDSLVGLSGVYPHVECPHTSNVL